MHGVLLAWQRPHNIPPIIAGMLKGGCQHVTVWSNCPELATKQLKSQLYRKFKEAVAVIGQGENIYTLGRYLAVKQVNAEYIATCDDDCLVPNWQELFQRCRHEHKLVANIKSGHFRRYVGPNKWVHPFDGGVAYEALVGWGAVFPAVYLDRLQLYTDAYGTDELLKRKADRIFTMIQARQHELVLKDVLDLPGSVGRNALFRRSDHYTLTEAAQKRVCELLACIKS